MDAAQYVPHLPTDVQALGADFLGFTGHKMCGPTGIGVLWARAELLEAMPPFLGGGEMILDVRKDGFLPNHIPHKFEAGTPPIAEIIGLGAAVRYLEGLGMDRVRRARGEPHRLRAAHTGGALRLGARGARAVRAGLPGRRAVNELPRHPPPRPVPRCSTTGACACGPATTAPSR